MELGWGGFDRTKLDMLILIIGYLLYVYPRLRGQWVSSSGKLSRECDGEQIRTQLMSPGSVSLNKSQHCFKGGSHETRIEYPY